MRYYARQDAAGNWYGVRKNRWWFGWSYFPAEREGFVFKPKTFKHKEDLIEEMRRLATAEKRSLVMEDVTREVAA